MGTGEQGQVNVSARKYEVHRHGRLVLLGRGSRHKRFHEGSGA